MMISLKEIMSQTKSPSQRVAIAEVMVTIAPNMNNTACLDICQLLFAAITRTKRADPRVAIGEILGELAQCLEDVDKASLAQTLRQEYLDDDSSKNLAYGKVVRALSSQINSTDGKIIFDDFLYQLLIIFRGNNIEFAEDALAALTPRLSQSDGKSSQRLLGALLSKDKDLYRSIAMIRALTSFNDNLLYTSGVAAFRFVLPGLENVQGARGAFHRKELHSLQVSMSLLASCLYNLNPNATRKLLITCLTQFRELSQISTVTQAICFLDSKLNKSCGVEACNVLWGVMNRTQYFGRYEDNAPALLAVSQKLDSTKSVECYEYVLTELVTCSRLEDCVILAQILIVLVGKFSESDVQGVQETLCKLLQKETGNHQRSRVFTEVLAMMSPYFDGHTAVTVSSIIVEKIDQTTSGYHAGFLTKHLTTIVNRILDDLVYINLNLVALRHPFTIGIARKNLILGMHERFPGAISMGAGFWDIVAFVEQRFPGLELRFD